MVFLLFSILLQIFLQGVKYFKDKANIIGWGKKTRTEAFEALLREEYGVCRGVECDGAWARALECLYFRLPSLKLVDALEDLLFTTGHLSVSVLQGEVWADKEAVDVLCGGDAVLRALLRARGEALFYSPALWLGAFQ